MARARAKVVAFCWSRARKCLVYNGQVMVIKFASSRNSRDGSGTRSVAVAIAQKPEETNECW